MPRSQGPAPRRRSYGADADRALDLYVALSRCAATMHRLSARDIQRYGLTQAQFAVLEVLHHKGPLPLRALGRKLLVTGGNVTFVTAQLAKAGLLQRRRSATDRRVIHATLTPKGEALMERCFPEHAACIARAAAVLPAREQARLARLLKRWGTTVSGV